MLTRQVSRALSAAGPAVDVPIHISRGSARPGGELRWEPPVSTGLVGQIAQPVALEDGAADDRLQTTALASCVFTPCCAGRLVLFFVRRTPPFSMVLAVSEDGRTFPPDRQLVVYEHDTASVPGLGVVGKVPTDDRNDDADVSRNYAPGIWVAFFSRCQRYRC